MEHATTNISYICSEQRSYSVCAFSFVAAFASVLCSSSSCARPEAPAQQATINNGDAQEEEQQQPKEQPKQLHRIRLDDGK